MNRSSEDSSLARAIERELQLSRIESTEKLLPWLRKYTPKDAFQTLTLIIGFLLVATFFRGLFLMGNMILVARVGQRTILDLQNQVFRNVLSMESHELGVQGTGDLVNRIRGETGLIGQAITLTLLLVGISSSLIFLILSIASHVYLAKIT